MCTYVSVSKLLCVKAFAGKSSCKRAKRNGCHVKIQNCQKKRRQDKRAFKNRVEGTRRQVSELSRGTAAKSRRCQVETSSRERRHQKKMSRQRNVNNLEASSERGGTRKRCNERGMWREKTPKRKRCQPTKDTNKVETDNGFGNQVIALPSYRLSFFLVGFPPYRGFHRPACLGCTSILLAVYLCFATV